MSPPLKLQHRDDPLAVGPDRTQATGETGSTATAVAEAPGPAQPPEVAPRPTRSRSTRRRAPAGSEASVPPSAPARATSEAINYDADRLEQTGWRIYDSLLAQVRDRAQELTDAGIPTSAAALAAATLHSHLPRTVEEGSDLMLAYRQATAGRRRARSAA